MDRANQPVDAIGGIDAINGIDSTVDPLAEEIRQSLLLLVGALGLMGMVATALLVLTAGSGG